MESEATNQSARPVEAMPESGGAIAFLAWVEVNKKRLMTIGAIAVVAALVISLFLQQQAMRERNASRALSDIKVPWNPAATNPPGTIEALVRLADDYRGTKAGARALLTAAGLLFSDKKYAEAEAKFAQLVKDYPDTQWAPEASYGIASSLDAQGKTAEATAKYEEIRRRFDKSPVIEDAKLSLARLYEASKPEDAIKLYDELSKGFPGTRVAMEASSREEDLIKARPELAKVKESLNPPPAPPPAAAMPTAQPQVISLTNTSSGTSKPVQINLSPKPAAAPAPAPAPAPAAGTAPAPTPGK